MNIFLDTSSLLKKYHSEEGTDKLFGYLEKTPEVIISPITSIELVNSLSRLYALKEIPREHFLKAVKTANQDLSYFTVIPFSDDLRNICFNLMKYGLKTLDLIQLASAVYANPDLFITSDKQQYNAARKELKKAILL